MPHDTVFAEGMYIDWLGKAIGDRPESTPDWVMGKFSFKADKFIETLQANVNSKGYVNIDLKKGQKGTPYLAVNTWKPKNQQPQQSQPPIGEDTRDFSNGDPDDIPF